MQSETTMRCHGTLLLVGLAILPKLAFADNGSVIAAAASNHSSLVPSSAPEPAPSPRTGLGSLAVGVNVPTSWFVGTVGASAYLGLSSHHAVRANFARFHVDDSIWPIRLVASDFSAVDPAGTIYDAGLSLLWSSRRFMDGLVLEAGVLRRDRNTVYWPEMSPKTETDTTAYSARAMIGWSWRVGRHGFVAAAIGGSIGRESGVEEVTDDDGVEPTREMRHVQRTQNDLETYVRWGIAIGD